jgi:DNA mismatch repair protein PMS2
VVQAYALVCVGVRISLCNTTATGKRQAVFSSAGAAQIRDNVFSIFPAKEVQGSRALYLSRP